MALARQPEAKVGAHSGRAATARTGRAAATAAAATAAQRVELLLERGQPCRDEVQVLEAEPLALRGGAAQLAQRRVLLAAAHGNLRVALAADALRRELAELA